MKLPRFTAAPMPLMNFFEEGLQTLGALCERTWHDRLEVLAEGAPASLWQADGSLHSVELHFPAPDAPGLRDAVKQAFAGSPLTFRLVEEIWQRRPPRFRACLAQTPDSDKPPAAAVAQKLWQKQFGHPAWVDASAWSRAWHFSLVAAVRCEVQAIDQSWSLHRLAVSLSDGRPDRSLEEDLDFCGVQSAPGEPPPWPQPKMKVWGAWLANALTTELDAELAAIQRRQQLFLERELKRLDEYFRQYEQEIETRRDRQQKEEARSRYLDRLRAAEAEHARRREDQVKRHEVRLIPHVDALLLIAETAWETNVGASRDPKARRMVFVSRARQWFEPCATATI